MDTIYKGMINLLFQAQHDIFFYSNDDSIVSLATRDTQDKA